jgi:hypothetical protein
MTATSKVVEIIFLFLLLPHLKEVFAAMEPDDNEAVSLVKKVIENQRPVNIVYDTEAIISFYSTDSILQSQREIASRYKVVEGCIVSGERLATEEVPMEQSLNESKGIIKNPKYEESNILPLFSPLSDKALPLYSFELAGEELKNGVESIVVCYRPLKIKKDFSNGLIWVSKEDTNLVALEMYPSEPFTFTEYFVMKMDYVKENELWVPEKITTDIFVNVLGVFKRIVNFEQRVVKRYYN